MTKKGTEGWKGYDIKDPATILTWRTGDLTFAADPAYLIYYVKHAASQGKQSAKDASRAWVEAKTFEVTVR